MWNRLGCLVCWRLTTLGCSPHTEVQRISFVGYTGGEGGSPRLWNLQNLHAVPPYTLSFLHKAKCIYNIVNQMVASTAFHYC